MPSIATPHHGRRILLVAAVIVLAVIAVVLIGEHHLKGMLVRVVSSRTGRAISIDGEVEAHLLSRHPSVSAREVTVGDPPWMPPGVTARAGRVLVLLEWQLSVPPLGVRRLEIDGAKLRLVRDAEGRANWYLSEQGAGGGPPLIHSLSIPDASVEVHDAPRHLEFTGTVAAGDAPAEGGAGPLHAEAAGQLNGRPVVLHLLADPLAEVGRDRPYHFRLDERSGATHLQGQGYLEHPFDFRQLQVTFQIRGPDMGDLYFAVGLKMPQTGAFRMSGKLERSGMRFSYTDLRASSGESDIGGRVSFGPGSPTEGQLTSDRLRLRDMGARAAGHAEAEAPALRIPDAPWPVAGLRKSNALVKVHVRELEIGPLVLGDASARVRIRDGVLSVAALKAKVAGGNLTGSARLDAAHAAPRGEVDVLVTDAQIDQVMGAKGSAAGLSGFLSLRAQLRGSGDSWHAMAATADGTVTAVIPRGTVRAALAEAASLELAGAVGLMTKSQKETLVRCAVGSFDAHEGVFAARTLVVDTDKSLITATGDVHMDTESLDFTMRGHPKAATLALRSAVAIKGTLRHPRFSLAGGGTAAETGVAAALGVTLAPVAAVLAFVNPGLAHDADCAALLGSAPAADPRQTESPAK